MATQYEIQKQKLKRYIKENKKTFIGYTVLIFITIGLIIFGAIVASKAYSTKAYTDNFIDFPKMGDAFKSGWYRTLGLECKPNLYKCKAKDQYWCSDRIDCAVPEHNLQGTLMKEPMKWFDRFV